MLNPIFSPRITVHRLPNPQVVFILLKRDYRIINVPPWPFPVGEIVQHENLANHILHQLEPELDITFPHGLLIQITPKPTQHGGIFTVWVSPAKGWWVATATVRQEEGGVWFRHPQPGRGRFAVPGLMTPASDGRSGIVVTTTGRDLACRVFIFDVMFVPSEPQRRSARRGPIHIRTQVSLAVWTLSRAF
ncbi:hypothetical protein MCOR25_001787 [Pyricularia grisea]|nr:hypothetical protein MCOR25_001787 [Pyricularia grisea]